ncbi:metallophosphoesterase family protein [Clostridium sp. chh4-2]|uniref:metallophosphoesterase family protein n=1 Tax=Clostridium sp. chh4-2 TaxID=2067550 RepID=UPI001FA8D697|nr:metallophosphoesterase family protein [Clostridium sp. chh4-2]
MGRKKMIYITGDCHGDYRRFNTEQFPQQRYMTKDDYVIICGDFGFWDNSREQLYWRKWLENKPFTTLWVDGNHENYDLLKEYPSVSWKGGKVQFITPSIIHLMRGQIYRIDGCRFFTFGGASSHDIEGGILDPFAPDFAKQKKRLRKELLCYRVNHVSWWKEEMPEEAEYEEGIRNLEEHDWTVDFIITHCCSSSTQSLITRGSYKEDSLTEFFERIKNRCSFRKWYFGHYHDEKEIGGGEILVYESIRKIL